MLRSEGGGVGWDGLSLFCCPHISMFLLELFSPLLLMYGAFNYSRQLCQIFDQNISLSKPGRVLAMQKCGMPLAFLNVFKNFSFCIFVVEHHQCAIL